MSRQSRDPSMRAGARAKARLAAKQRSAAISFSLRRRLRFEPVEDRRLLSITVNTLADENDGSGVGGVSLRDAIVDAAPGATIEFDPSLTSGGPATILLTHGELLISKALTIASQPAAIVVPDQAEMGNNGCTNRSQYISAKLSGENGL